MGEHVTCLECNGEVNVPTMNGTKLRCGCGKMTIDPPPDEKRAELRTLLAVLREYRVSQYKAGEFMLVLHPDAWRAEPASQPDTSTTTAPPEPSRICKCGHHLVAEHSEGGCLQGCSLTLCESTFAEAA